ncbi:MDR family MFS transporter [Streptomyces sp. YIM 98790]|uniref:MDR family MFS transporter n=1 Tax=Streptomyces sp. YIM 98790 TaxID=2689077 RepID=UPI00140A0C26|nr:MDR family MFS transporter [Streptomyces sp. YIM 98790]
MTEQHPTSGRPAAGPGAAGAGAADPADGTAPPPDAAGRPPRSIRVILIALSITILLAMLDNMIVATAMPTIVGELGGLAHLSWVVTAYTLATAASTPIWGKLGDLYGRKGIYLASIVIFLAGSVTSGAAQTMGQLIGFRALQGLGAGGLLVGTMAIIGELIPPRERGKYQGMFASVMAVAMIGGPLLGGVITDHLGWRWAFYINVPLGAAALIMVTTVLHLPRRRGHARIDYPGAVLLTTGIVSLVLVTTWGGSEYAWGSATILGLIALGVACLALFLFVETRVPEPLLPLHIFRSGNFSLVTWIGFLLGFVMFGSMIFLPLFQQTVQGASATNSGLLMLPMLLSMMLVSLVVGRIITATGRYRWFPVAGGALILTGLSLLSTMDTGTGRLATGVFMALVGAGMGFLMQLTMLIAQNSVEMKDMGVASSTATLSRTLGGSFGVALLGAFFNHRVGDSLAGQGAAAGTGGDGGQGVAVTETGAQLDPASLAELPAGARAAYETAVAAGTHTVFLAAALVSVLAFAAGWFIKETPLRGASTPPAAGTEAEEDVPVRAGA